MHKSFFVPTLAALCLTTLPTFAQNASTPLSSPPPLIEGLRAAAGVSVNFRASLGTSSYYSLIYKDRTLTDRGTKINYLDTTHQFVIPDETPKLPNGATTPRVLDTKDLPDETQSFLFNLATGSVQGSGNFFNALGINSFLAPRLNLGLFRTTGGISGSLDGREILVSLGVETPSLHLSQLKPRGQRVTRRQRSLASVPANWLNFGLAGRQQFQHGFAGAKDQLSGLITYRGFIGNSFRWRPSNTRTLPFTLEEFKAKYGTLKMAQERRIELSAAQNAHPTNKFPNLVDALVASLATNEAEVTEANYSEKVNQRYAALKAGYLLEPTWALWVESNGQYDFTGNAQGDRFKNNLATVATYAWDTGRGARSQIQLRYENGYPTGGSRDKVDRFVASFGLNF